MTAEARDWSLGYPNQFETEAQCKHCKHTQVCQACPGHEFMTPYSKCMEWIFIKTPAKV